MKETRFKDTEVGRIPEDWQLIPIRELAKDMADGPFGSNLKTEHYTIDKQVRIIQLGNIGDCGWLDDNTKYTTYEHAKTLSRCIATPGSILVAKMMPAGRSVVCPSEEKQYILGSDVVRIVPNEKLIAEYFVYQSKSDIYLSQIAANTQGSTRQRTSISKLKDIYIPFPSTKSEQTRIATALSNIDTLISELGALIEKKRAIKQGAMQQLLTGKKRLKGFSEPWVEKKLGEIGDFNKGIGIPRAEANTGTIPAIRYGELYTMHDYYIKRFGSYISSDVARTAYRLKKGDLLFTCSGETKEDIGKSAAFIDDIEAYAGGDLIILSPFDNYDALFLGYITNSQRCREQKAAMGQGDAVVHISVDNIKRIQIILPPTHAEQSAIASVLTSMDDEISALEAKKAKYEQIKQGMMQQLLTGKIRLVETAIKTNVTSANVHFRRSVLAAEIAERLYEEPTFGHVKMEKMLFLTERLCHIDIGSHYHRDAAGPYDNRALRSIDSQLKKQKWFDVKRTEKGNRYVPMQNCGKHKSYFDKYYSTVLPIFEKIIDTFKTQNTERCEIVATLYSAWEDLLHSNKPFTDTDIVNEVLNNWHESKKRISQDRWLSAIQWMRENGFAPDVRNNESRK